MQHAMYGVFHCNLSEIQNVLIRICFNLKCQLYVSWSLTKQRGIWSHCNSQTSTEFCLVKTRERIFAFEVLDWLLYHSSVKL